MTADHGLDYWEALSQTQVAPRLWVSSYPLPGAYLARRIDVLALCAMELQDVSGNPYPGLADVYLCPLDDSGPPPTEQELRDAHATARDLARHLKAGQRVMCSCRAGRNRSGLCAALTLRQAYGITGQAAANIVRGARPECLSNPHFAAHLRGLPAPGAKEPQRPRQGARLR